MIKICGVRDVETALFSCEQGATAIGLVFADSPRRLDTSTASEIVRELELTFPKVIKVAVVRHSDLPVLPNILQQVNIDLIQVHGSGTLPVEIQNTPTMRAGSVSTIERSIDVSSMRTHVPVGCKPIGTNRWDVDSTVLIDSPNGAGLGQPWDYSQARKLNKHFKVIIAGGLNLANVVDAVQQAYPHGVDVSSSVESSKGIKDNSMIKDFLQAAKSALQLNQNTRETCNK